jgi:murein DD-endopeptidase MepM/ murein hydrolase activator NlpD
VKTGRHRFPIAGVFSFGGADGRFGARRKGHRHQGQDLPAASGTPVVAPYRGVVAAVQYQARGAGHYVVIHSADYDYVFMHLLGGSTLVAEGQRVRTGQRIASVGSSGESTGPHLHFELWLGGWFAGGDPIDPLPLLQAWSGVSPASG